MLNTHPACPAWFANGITPTTRAFFDEHFTKKAGIQYGSRPFYTPVKGSELFRAEVDLRGYAEITIGFTRNDVTVRTAGAA